MMYLIIFVFETCIITYIYFKCDYLITNCSFRFGICFFSGFLQFCLKNIILLSKNYFKFVLNIVNLIKNLFFVAIIPMVLQYFLIFHFFFEYIWTIYLLLIVYFLIISTPYYLLFNSSAIPKSHFLLRIFKSVSDYYFTIAIKIFCIFLIKLINNTENFIIIICLILTLDFHKSSFKRYIFNYQVYIPYLKYL